MKGELVDPNSQQSLNRYNPNLLSRSVGSDIQRNLVKSLSLLFRPTCIKAFSLSVDRPEVYVRNRKMIEHMLLRNGGPTMRQ